MTDTVAVTGGNGQIGRAVLDHLSGVGYRTVNLSRGSREESHADAYLRTDTLEMGEVYGSLAKSDADAVVHLGMIPTPESGPGYRTFESNAMSTYHVLEAASGLGIDTVALASSLSAVGGGFEPDPIAVDEFPVDESQRPTPSTSYGLGKQTLEILADGFARRSDGPRTITSLRFPWVVDDEMARETFVEPDRRLAALRDSEHFRTQRNTLFAYAHVSDVVSLVEATVTASFDGHERVWVSAPDTVTETPTRELLAEVYPDAELRDGFPDSEYASLVDTAKATSLFDWQPQRRWRDEG
ncbi:NAD-dependent epimerase/dehydratase family protein [Haloarcula onubensis]|uniref:NAD(P)-dependent oxidoreductase n=1 Tax=Haloarcula onubensis TaxID=2950539 RepID=A0ABU2FTF0_9EURY|nr:NAD(P)-dependent oxidoreductase [Halomicroarcula sp. S3CR25-11]MDS0283537.1 NAD(P)-dependent oxidoreductase [Halomicroarcula sp. S3CR25-11]